VITFTTDFGPDWYVGALKGAALSVNPRVTLVDITHAVSPTKILEGAFVLAAGCRDFPAGTVHVAVIDPGVGTDRRGLVVETEKFKFVGPDNGVLSIAAPASRVTRAFVIENRKLFSADPSSTFHGRDIFAPVAAHLSLGVDPSETGRPAGQLRDLSLPEVRHDGAGGWVGEILFFDSFGNAITNVPGEIARDSRGWEIRVGKVRIGAVLRTYGDVAVGRALALVGSHGYLEIAERGGSARRTLALAQGAEVSLKSPTS
jgi:S-adenosylmethionine hydrolase